MHTTSHKCFRVETGCLGLPLAGSKWWSAARRATQSAALRQQSMRPASQGQRSSRSRRVCNAAQQLPTCGDLCTAIRWERGPALCAGVGHVTLFCLPRPGQQAPTVGHPQAQQKHVTGSARPSSVSPGSCQCRLSVGMPGWCPRWSAAWTDTVSAHAPPPRCRSWAAAPARPSSSEPRSPLRRGADKQGCSHSACLHVLAAGWLLLHAPASNPCLDQPAQDPCCRPLSAQLLSLREAHHGWWAWQRAGAAGRRGPHRRQSRRQTGPPQ